jgi:hypothetical protein
MADPGLVQALDYILNHSDEGSLDALTAAVVRRRNDLAAFNAVTGMPDPKRMAEDITGKINAGVGGSIESIKDIVRDMTIKIIKEHAPELNDKQIKELCKAWIPEKGRKNKNTAKEAVNPQLVLFMVEQFISFSQGTMSASVDKNLRDEMGAWPERYWKAFPPVIRTIITDFLKDRITEKEFNQKIGIALEF